jgi:putative membrane protein
MSSEVHRLHPAAFLVHALQGFTSAMVPLLVALVTTGPSLSSGLLLTAAGGAIGLVAGYARWNSTTYWWTPTALHLRSGVFSPDEQTIPLARIAAIDDHQGIVQRLCGVVELHVQTGSGGAQGEIVLTAVSHEAAAELREAGGHAGAGIATASDAVDLPGWSLSRRGLVLAALTGPQVGVIAPALGGVIALATQVLQFGDADAVARLAPDTMHGWVMAAVALVTAAALASLGGAIVGFAGFRAETDGTRLRIRRGLLQRRAASIGLDRVLAVRIVEGSLRRPLGLCSVRLEVAGYADEAAVAQTLVPLCQTRDVPELLALLVPALVVPAAEDAQRPAARAWRGYVGPPVALLAAAAALVIAVVADLTHVPGAVWAAVPAAGAAGAALGLLRLRDAAWWRAGDTVATRERRVLVRSTLVAQVRTLQHRELAQSVLQRRAGLAAVRFAVASGGRGRITGVELPAARGLLAGLGRGQAFAGRRIANSGAPHSGQ